MSFRACEEIRPLLSDGVAGDLAPTETDSVTSHLSACRPCREHAEELLWQDRVLAELGAEARIDQLLARIRSHIDRERPLEVSAEGSVRSRRTWLPWAVAAAACAAVVAGGLLFFPGSNPSSPDIVQHPPAPKPGPAPVTNPNRFLPASEPVPAPAPAPAGRKDAPVSEPAPSPARVVVRKAAPPEEKPEPVVKKSPAPAPKPKPAPVAARAKKERPKDAVIDIPRRLTTGDAIALGVKYLQGRVEGVMKQGQTADRKVGENELLLWTLVHAGVPESHPTFRALFREMMDRPLERTYRVALQAMILEEVDRVKYQPRIAQCAQFLLDNQCRSGLWSYGDPSIFAERQLVAAPSMTASRVRKPKRIVRIKRPAPGERVKPKVVRRVSIEKKREGRGSGDNSNSMYAALGLRACHDAGIVLPKRVIDRAQAAWRSAQKGKKGEARGWCYGGKSHADHPAYGSMTAGAVGSLAIYDYIQKKDWAQDRDVRDGLAWLATHFSVEANPGTPEHGAGNPQYAFFYYMYALERAGMLVGTDTMGKHDWYTEGEKSLLDVQRVDGSWNGGNVRDTCFAILFLKRATTPLPSISTGGRR